VPARPEVGSDLVGILNGTLGRFTQHSAIVVDGTAPAAFRAHSEAAKAAGWAHSKVDAWTLFYREDGRTVALGLRDAMSTRHLGVLFDKQTDPGVLALHLDRYHQVTGNPWRGTPATSAHNAIRLTWGNKAYQPVWSAPRIPASSDVGFISWSRPLSETEIRWGWLYTFDANSAYLGSAVNAEVAWGPLHHTGPQQFDAGIPGYWHCDLPTALLEALADPCRPPLLRTPRNGQAWLTTPYLKLLEDLGYQCLIVDSWTGREEFRAGGGRLHPAGSRIFRSWSEGLRDGLRTAPEAVVLAAKRTYKDAVGGMQKEGMRISRRDWGESIIDLWRATLMRRIIRIYEGHGVWPVRVATDSVTYAAGTGLESQLAEIVGCRPGLGGFHLEETVTAAAWLERYPVTQGGRRPRRSVTK
jgi:hypothetical protein